MTNQKPTVSQPRNQESCSSSSGFRLLDSEFHTFLKCTIHNCYIIIRLANLLLFALFITTPALALAQTNDQADLSPGNDQPSQIDQPSRFDNLQAEPDMSKLKITQPKIVLPEGYPISGRRAKLVKLPDDHRWFLIFDEALQTLMPELDPKNDSKSEKPAVSINKASKTELNASKPDKKVTPTVGEKILESEDPFSHPMEVLPGKWLAAMTKVMGNRVDLTVDLRVWGEATTYHNRNFILPTFVATLSLFGQDAAEKAKATPKINPLEATFGQPKTADTKITKQTQITDKFTLPKKLRDALISIPRTRPLELDDLKQTHTLSKPAVAKSIQSEGKKTSKQDDWRDGYMIIDRVGRIHFDPEGMRWLFMFEADGASLAEPPVSLHPCRLLEVMETSVSQSAVSIRFRISGQISQYQGRNYMLLRKVLMVYELGNLNK